MLTRRGDQITFFPTYGCRNRDGSGWRIHVHGWVYCPKKVSLKRAAMLSLLRRAARLDRETIAAITMKGRLAPFLYDNKRGRRIAVRLGAKTHELPASKPNGHFAATIDVADEELPGVSPADTATIPLLLVNRGEAGEDFAGSVRLIADEGLSVISDIDDTIKISQVTQRRELMANTFLRDFQPAAGMAALYRRWAEAGVAFHYVSASPWQLFAPLLRFLNDERFPAGSIHLREFRLKDRSFVEFLSDTDQAKKSVCQRILCEFPRRRFMLVGDSGERDPEMYGELVRRHPDQIQHVSIRNVTGASRGDERFRRAFDGIGEEKWTLFADGGDIEDEP